jgi:hypothetical protein
MESTTRLVEALKGPLDDQTDDSRALARIRPRFA